MIRRARQGDGVNRAWRGDFVRFLTIGGITALFYGFVVYVFVSLWGWSPGLGVIPAYGAALLLNYTAHYFWTYRSNAPHKTALRRYIIANVIFFSLNTLIMSTVPDLLDVHYALVQFFALGMLAMATFLLQRQWIFLALRQ